MVTNMKMDRLVSTLFVVLLLGLLAGPLRAQSDPNPNDNVPLAQASEYACYFTEGPIVIDGKADEAAWKVAQPVNDFTMAWARNGKTKPVTATAAQLLWDREHLYFFATMEDTDLYADVSQHDGVTWDNDVFELFFKPADDKPGYYEFQVNAAGTTMDVFFPRRGAGGFGRFKSDGEFDFPVKVVLDGSLNKWSDKDKGWQVEGRLSWKDFARSGGRPNPGEVWKYTLCRYDYSVDFEGPALSTSATMSTNAFPNFHYWEDYAPIRFVGPDQSPRSQAAKPFGIETLPKLTTSKVLGSPEPPPPFTVERIFPNLPLEHAVTIVKQPKSDWVWVVTQPRSYAPASLYRFRNQPAANELEKLIAADGDAALYAVTFHPQFAENGYVFVGSNGSYGGPKRSRVTRYRVDPQSGAFDAASATVMIEWESDGHNGAAIAFGNDRMLYVTSGDGTSDSDENLRGQDLSHLTAKVLRIDVDGAEQGQTYRVPDDNPFVGQDNVRPETWCYGLRNPWRITVDPKTGQIWVGQNGQDLWEQVYLVQRGANYGWSVVEGAHDFYPDRPRGPHPISKPIVDHPHSEARSLTGGIVYHGGQPDLRELEGAYLYGDYSTGKIWAIKHDGNRLLWHKEIADTSLSITAFTEGNDGDVWVLDHMGSAVYRLILAPRSDPQSSFPRKLSETGLFKNVARHEMADGVIPYSVNSPLWSDGSHKERFLAIPHHDGDERRIEYSHSNGWTFPNETVLVKSFALDTVSNDRTSRRWIETRFMLRQQNEWVGYSYRWNDQGTDAELVESAGTHAKFTVPDPSVPGGRQELSWRYPSRSECMVCHSRAANYVLGLQTGQMNRDHDYSSVGGCVDNQLRTLEHLGLFRVSWNDAHSHRLRTDFLEQRRSELGDPAFESADEQALNRELGDYLSKVLGTREQRETPKHSTLLYRDPEHFPKFADPYDDSQPLVARARSYLHSNCAHCHVAAGGGNAKIDLHFDTPMAKRSLLDQKPSHHTFDISDARIIAMQDPARSTLLHRLKIRGNGQMPQLATSLPDKQAIELLEDWIRSLEP